MTHSGEGQFQNLRVALVQDWLTGMRGGEKVLEAACDIFPEADIFTLVCVPENISDKIRKHRIETSFIQSFPFARRKHQVYFPMFPAAIEKFELGDYDLVVSTSHCVAKGVLTRPHSLHVCYCHTPMRYAWDFRNLYIDRTRPHWLASAVLPFLLERLRTWDEASAHRVDCFVANSHNVRRRIAKYYRRQAQVLHPPADLSRFRIDPERKPEYYLLVSAMVPYKRDDLAVKVLAERGAPFVVVGNGPERSRLEKIARGKGEFRGRLDAGELVRAFQGARALLYPGEEDFGITPVEANACGRPVIAYGAGGVLESQAEGETVVFFREQTEQALHAAFDEFEKGEWDTRKIRKHAKVFDLPQFRTRLESHVRESWTDFQSSGRERTCLEP